MSLCRTFGFVTIFFLAFAFRLAAASETNAENSMLIKSSERSVAVMHYSAPGKVRRPSVLLLHGYQCVEACAADFQRYGRALASKGIDAYVVNYYSASDVRAVAARQFKTIDYDVRFKEWTRLVREIARIVARQPRADGRVALIGFSQGGKLAIASAADNPDIAALVVFYARLPQSDELEHAIRKLPPLLLLHGADDKLVPLSDGNAAFLRAQTLGNQVEMVVYPKAGHGFDFAPTGKDPVDACRRVISFMQIQLGINDKP
jgi:dienelactone hydrolase